MDWKNKLYFGDNLGILREHVAAESIDLIYLDPVLAELLEGKKIQSPEHRVETSAKAERKMRHEQERLF